MTDEIIILVTCKAAESDKIASHLVEEKLAACVNIVPGVLSIYAWQGEICRDSENLLIIKTERSVWSVIEQRIRELHPYDVPEILCLPIEAGHSNYLDWINASVKSSVC